MLLALLSHKQQSLRVVLLCVLINVFDVSVLRAMKCVFNTGVVLRSYQVANNSACARDQ